MSPSEPQFERDLGDGGRLLHFPNFLDSAAASQLFESFQSLPYEHPERMGNRTLRGTLWYAEPACDYSYSGITLSAREFTAELDGLKNRLNEWLPTVGLPARLNSVLVNYYPNGRAWVNWHADDERCFEPDPEVVSVSLGQERLFELTPIGNLQGDTVLDRKRVEKFSLAHGSVFVMAGSVQRHWKHCLPKTARKSVGARVNLTWRPYRIEQSV